MRQRVVLVIAAGVAIAALASATKDLILDRQPDGGWFAYAPNTGIEYSPDRAADTWTTVACAFVWVTVAYGDRDIRAELTQSEQRPSGQRSACER